MNIIFLSSLQTYNISAFCENDDVTRDEVDDKIINGCINNEKKTTSEGELRWKIQFIFFSFLQNYFIFFIFIVRCSNIRSLKWVKDQVTSPKILNDLYIFYDYLPSNEKGNFYKSSQ